MLIAIIQRIGSLLQLKPKQADQPRFARIEGVLRIHRIGRVTVLGFTAQYSDVPLQMGVAVRDGLKTLIESHHCRVLAFDLSGVKYIPSSLLGMLASISSLVDELYLYNPSEAICEVMEIYGLDKIMKINLCQIESNR